MFTVDTNVTKEEIIERMKAKIALLERGNLQAPCGSPVFSKEDKRWIIPDKNSYIMEVTGLRVKKLMEYLIDNKLAHTTRRDVWYGITTGKWGLYHFNICPKCGSTSIRTEERDTGRKKKTGEKITTTDLICNQCALEFTEIKDPYATLGNDITIIERLIAVEKEDMGFHAGGRGFMIGSERMRCYSKTRSWLDLKTSPSIIFDLPSLSNITGFNKIIMLEKESFVGHIIPVVDQKYDFSFVNAIDCAIITSMGYEGKYNKSFIRQCIDSNITPLSLHDGDGDGISMDLILQFHAQSCAHLGNDLILQPYRMGYFPTIAKKVGSPATPMAATHIKSLEDVEERLSTVRDDLYQEEVDLLKQQQERWELQSMSALDKTAGQAYILEYLRNRKIPLKDKIDPNYVREQYYDTYKKENVLNNLKDSVREAIKDFIREKVTDKIVEEIMPQINQELIDEVNNISVFEDLPDQEDLHNIIINKLAKRITSQTKDIEDSLVNEMGSINTNSSVEMTDDELNKTVSRNGDVVLIHVPKIKEHLTFSAERSFEIPEPPKTIENLYDSVLRRCDINKHIALKFKSAFSEKLGEEPEPENEFDDKYFPEDGFDDLSDSDEQQD